MISVHLLIIPQDLVPTRSYGSYGSTSAPSSHPSYTPTTASQYPQDQQATVGPYGYDADALRRSSYQYVTFFAESLRFSTNSVPRPMSTTRASVSDEIASARGMVAMAHQDPIGRANSYPIPATTRSGSESYPYPQTHSQHSSISSASTYPYYSGSYTGSLDGSSVTDYSSASEDAMGQRTLPAPNQLIHGFPPNPETMMNQFNAKMSPSAQKKHKCKICDKRFTRPSSLQTHMYSHTGEKRKLLFLIKLCHFTLTDYSTSFCV